MRAIFIIAMFVFYSQADYSQKKIEGLGDFKIGKSSTGEVIDLAKKRKVEVKTIEHSRDFAYITADENSIFEIKPNADPSFNPAYAQTCKDGKAFLIKRYKAMGYEIDNVYLLYHNNVLVGINCLQSFYIEKAITSKLGGPIESKKRNDGECGFIESIVKKWPTTNIVCMSSVTTHYDRNCKRSFIETFLMYDNDKLSELNICNDSTR